MFVRLVEIVAKQGKAKQLCDTIYEKVLPTLKKHSGFVDLTIMTPDNDPVRVTVVGYWKSREDAERYHREDYSRVLDLIRNLYDREPAIRGYSVESSTSHRFVSTKAA